MTAVTEKGKAKEAPERMLSSFRYEPKSEEPFHGFTEINDEKFVLRELDGIELLDHMSIVHTSRGVALFLQRVIQPDDWDRFRKTTQRFKPAQFVELAGKLVDAYAEFPTTEDSESSTG